MNRLKLLVAAALLGLPLAACEEGTAPPPVGQIDGQVVIEGEGIDGVSVTLSSGAATTTSGGGHFSFMDVEGGTYTITISGYPDDASFNATTAEVTIATSGQMADANFSGSWIRTASLMGMVTVEGEGLPGITVSVAGRQEEQMLTDDNGQYTFTGLRAGNYTVEITGFDATDVAFSATSSAVEVAVGESEVWSFDGTYVRESTIAGQVSVEGNGLAGVTVSLQGMGADDEQNTDTGGQYTFSGLRAGEYQLAISGFDTDEYGFSTTSATIRVEHGRTANIPFEGILLRTAAIMGQVSVEGEGLADVTVSLSGEGESHTTMTDNSGQYAFSDLPAGNFQVGISGYDTDDYSFETTSKNVALAIGETTTVPFEGILLRTSGISGRVSVEGTGLDSVTVTLSGDDLEEDLAVMTDASGQYAIAGLAEGDYTVAISGFDAVAYIFEMTSMDVTLGDDDTQIVNFTGAHARTASVSGMIYADEAAKNDSYDEGEHAIPAPGVVLALVGPGILDQTPGATGPDGSFSFGELRAGPYQLVVTNAAAAGADYAYGGPAAGYGFNLGVGDEETQNIPFDITHTTVNFSVNLKSGANMGAALPGATVTLYSDLAGELKITDGTTGDDGMASMRIARAGTTGNTVYAAVAAPAGSYHTSGAMQAVMWDPQMTAHPASNNADIVNTMASFSFGGATVMTDFGGGMALGGWKVSVTSGADDEAVDGAPTALGADGSASFSEAVAAADLPKTYEIEMVGWKAQSNDTLTGDGGERYTSTTLSHTHDGLSLAGTSTDAGMLEVTYTTQTLRVYVHQENDQVMGYTGNVLGGDARMGGIIDVDLRYIADNGRSRSFEATDSVRSSASGGVHTFRNVPAAANVIVIADEYPTLGNDADGDPIANTAHLLDKNGHTDEVATFTDVEANGIMGGAFGEHGGFHHTVELCPLVSAEGNQRHGECGTFAFVETYAVNGQAWKSVRGKTSDDFASANTKSGVKGLTVSMDPVDGENLAGVDESFTAKSAGNLTFDFNRMPAGVYKVTAPSGWKAQRGPLESPTNDLAARLNPLDSALNIDVTPATGYAYGAVTDSENRRMAGVTVNVNGVSVETDSNGRYIAEGFGPSNYRAPVSLVTQRNRIVVTTAEEGSEETTNLGSFAANTPRRIDVKIADAAEVTTISGKVTHANGGAGVGGVRVWVDGRAPLNKNARSSSRLTSNDIYITASDGSYSVRTPAKAGGASAIVTVSRDGMFFSSQHSIGAVAGAHIQGINFTAFDNGTIHGRVVDGSNNPISGVIVTADQVGGDATDADTTGTTGTYSLSVRYGQYGVSAAKHGYTFTSASGITVPNDGKAIDDLVGTQDDGYSLLSSLSLSGVSLCRANSASCATASRGFRSATTAYYATVGNTLSMTTVSATAGGGARVTEIYPDDAETTTAGHQIALDVGTTDIEVQVVSKDNKDTKTYTVAVTRRATSTVITGTITDAQKDEDGNTVGVASVQIRVGGGTLIGGDRFNARGYVTTNSSGEYKAEVESTGGAGTVTPTKAGYSFDPASQTVTLNSGAVSGIDFIGSSYATITGTVMADGAALEGATVTATIGGKPYSDTSDRRGRYSVNVPAGTAIVTAKVDGYTFLSVSVDVDASETRTLNITATGTIQPTNVNGERDTDADGALDGMATVTWEAGGAGSTGVTYAVQACVVNADATPAVTCDTDDAAWDNNAFGTWNAGDDLTVTAAVPSDSDNGFMVRVTATAGDLTLESTPDEVGAIDVQPSNATATRRADLQQDSLVVTWNGDRAASGTTGRIIIGVTSDSTTNWVTLGTIDFGADYTAGDDPDHTYRIALPDANGLSGAAVVDPNDGTAVDADDDGTGDTMDVSRAMVNARFMVRVQMRQANVDVKTVDGADVETWKSSASVTVNSKG